MRSLHPAAVRSSLRALALVAAAAAAITLPACSRTSSKELQPGSYRAVVAVDGDREVPFELDVAREESGLVLYVVNAEERLRVTDLQVVDGRLEARFPDHPSRLEARVAGEQLQGTLTLVHDGGRELALPFEARLGETWRFFPESRNDNADMAGRWQIDFTPDVQPASDSDFAPTDRGVVELQQRFGEVTGTVLLPTGDQRGLAGEVFDDELRLSRFDGGSLVLYTGKLDAQGRWVGETWTEREGARGFVAERNPDAMLGAPEVGTPVEPTGEVAPL